MWISTCPVCPFIGHMELANHLDFNTGLSGRLSSVKYQLPQDLQEELGRRLERSHREGVGSRSQDGTAIMIQGGPFYGCFLSPEGDAFIETYDVDLGPTVREWTKVDRSRRAQIMTIVLAAKFDLTFGPLTPQLPQQTPEATTCPLCEGSGWHFNGGVICHRCCGFGWYDARVFEGDPAE